MISKSEGSLSCSILARLQNNPTTFLCPLPPGSLKSKRGVRFSRKGRPRAEMRIVIISLEESGESPGRPVVQAVPQVVGRQQFRRLSVSINS